MLLNDTNRVFIVIHLCAILLNSWKIVVWEHALLSVPKGNVPEYSLNKSIISVYQCQF